VVIKSITAPLLSVLEFGPILGVGHVVLAHFKCFLSFFFNFLIWPFQGLFLTSNLSLTLQFSKSSIRH
jgi:hypothetical protein